MAFDYGSINLGLKNPFKLEGAISAIRGVVVLLVGIYLLISAAAAVKTDPVQGWILMVFGIIILGTGVKNIGQGIFATLRYFVGRNHPASLARNRSASESSGASAEAQYTAYTDKQLEEMLMGRKNITFTEPQGFLSRLLHTLIPKLLFVPYPVRNLAQRVFGAWIATIVALVSYALIAFVSVMGFAGEAGEIAFPIYSAFLLFYLLFTWRNASKPIDRAAQKTVETLGAGSLVKIITLSIIMPVVVGLAASWVMTESKMTKIDIDTYFASFPSLHVGLYLVGLLVIALAATSIIFIMLRKRLQNAEPTTEVSELRENWQASIHPNEVFINLDNLVMANRRYKEVPNRVYREIDPQLEAQVDGKGSFKGELIQEIQPTVKPMELGGLFAKMRLLALVLGNVMFVGSMFLVVLLAYGLIDIYEFFKAMDFNNIEAFLRSDVVLEGTGLLVAVVHFMLLAFLIRSFARLLTNSAHLFFAEMQFESLLVYFKCEGTFTESKISTGMSIHDSTRSENTVVRSSITPWVIVSRLTTSIFAATGMKNLEYPRYIMSMYKEDRELNSIKEDVRSFLDDRESIAAITNERDLGNASQVHQLNQQTRAAVPNNQALEQQKTDEAAGFLRQEAASEDAQSN